jgi:hypothetical protein
MRKGKSSWEQDSADIVITMGCGHEARFKITTPPAPGESMWCIRCGKQSYRPYLNQSEEWGWLCASKQVGCGGFHGVGAAPSNAMRGATKHFMRHPGHEVFVVKPDGTVQAHMADPGKQEGLF